MKKPRPEIVDHAIELFARLGDVRAKAMFGGWGFYCDDRFFALIADDILYLKADAETEADFHAAGSTPFSYTLKEGRSITMGYWSAPEESLESPHAMQPWATRALAAALRAKTPPRRKAR